MECRKRAYAVKPTVSTAYTEHVLVAIGLRLERPFDADLDVVCLFV